MAEPKLRFKKDDGRDFESWEYRPLEEYMQSRDVRQIPTEEAPLKAFVANVGVVDKGEKYDRSALVKSDDKTYKRTEYNDFIYSSNNLDVGSIGLNKNGTAVISDVYEIFQFKSNANPECMNMLIQWPRNLANVIRYRQGALYGQYRIYARDFLRVEVNAPTIEEQQKIAEFLSNVDEVIAASEQEVENLEMQKKAVMKKIFSQEVRFKKPDGSDFPEWEEKTIGSLGETKGGGTPSTKNEDFWNGNIPWISSSDLVDDNIHSISVTRYITEEAVNKSATKIIPANSIIIVTRVGLGKVAVSTFDLCTSQDFMSISSTQDNAAFLAYLISNEMQQRTKKGQGTSIKGMTSETVKSIAVFIPHIEEQKLISDFLTSFDEAIAAAKEELVKWKELKKGLLQQMFV